MDSFSFSLLFKEDDFSPKSEAQSFIRFGPLDEMDERDVLLWANRNKYSYIYMNL